MAKKKSTKPGKTAKKKSAVKKASPKKVVKKAAPKKAIKKATALTLTAVDTEHDVKERIITNSPKEDVEVEDLTDEMLLKENLDYQNHNLSTLHISLDNYVNDRDSSQHVSSSDITNNKTVGKIVKMVKNKLNED